VNSIADIWRGEPYPKHLHLLDNDFFGQPEEQWRARVAEILDGGFKVCFNQGINIRLITEQAAEWIAKLPYYDDQFKTRRLYTAWDNLKDEGSSSRASTRLEAPASRRRTSWSTCSSATTGRARRWSEIMYRFERMVARHPALPDGLQQREPDNSSGSSGG
jgi:hypothetical protein